MTTSPAITALIAGASEPPAPLFITRFVDAIVAALAVGMPASMRVDPMPDKTTDFDIGSYDGAVLVHYKGGKYDRPAGPLGITGHQTRRLDLDIHMLVRGLSTPLVGAYDVLERARLLLQGRSFEGASPIECVDDGLVQEKDGIWDYALQIRASAPAPSRRVDERNPMRPNLSETP